MAPLPPLPPGSDRIAAWALARRLRYHARPDIQWFEAWEPFDTMVAAELYFNAVSWQLPGGTATAVEPWFADPGGDPLARVVLLFIAHPGFVRHVAARGGEHPITRVAYLDRPPPPTVQLGDILWDQHMSTYAASASEAAAGIPPPARQLLAEWGFRGHLEIRPGCLIVHFADLQPVPEGLEPLLAASERLLRRFAAGAPNSVR